MTFRSFLRTTFVLSAIGSFLACAAEAPKRKKTAGEAMEGSSEEETPPAHEPDYVNEDASFNLSSRPGTSVIGARAAKGSLADGGGAPCTGALKNGDVRVVEFMPWSVGGSGDFAEWVEVENTQPCLLNVKGLTVESPRGDAGDGVLIDKDTFLEPNDTLVVSGSVDPKVNHDLPTPVFSWKQSDVLKNEGDDIVLRAGTVEIDRLHYGRFSNLPAGTSLSFPVDCTWDVRSDFKHWSPSSATYGGTFKGTPNSPNTDVKCNDG